MSTMKMKKKFKQVFSVFRFTYFFIFKIKKKIINQEVNNNEKFKAFHLVTES